MHHWAETGETKREGTAKEFTRTLEKKLFLSGTERETWWNESQGRHEVTFAFNPFTLKLVMFRGRRGAADAWKKGKRWNPLRWVTGTIDWLAKRGGRWWVDDLKTGAFPVYPDDSGQLKSYAVVAWMLDGMPDEWECDVSIMQWPKYPLPDGPKRTWHKLTANDLRAHLDAIRWTLTDPEEQVNPVSYGPPQPDENGNYQFGGKLPVCAGCEARLPMPGVSEWITNFWFRTYPHCWEGIKKRILNG